MKSIGTRFTIAVGVCAAVFSIVLLLNGWLSTRSHLQQLTALQAELALEFDLAIRECVAETIHPLHASGRGEEETTAEMMSTTFVAHQVFERVRARFPDYVIKFSSLNPRNPANLAGPEEVRYLEYFRDHPSASRWNGTIQMNGREYLAYVNAVRVQESCLRCHGNPDDSPEFLVDRYGTAGGFNQKVGDVAGMDMIAVPTDNVGTALLQNMNVHLLATGVLLIGLCTAIIVAFRLIVTRRLAAISRHFQVAAGQSDNDSLARVPEEGKDEIGILAASFNVLIDRLRCQHETLESRVQQRTDDLARANLTLQDEILERERLEREVHRIGAREQERIGQELHDGLGQELTGLSYLAASLHQRLRDQDLPEAENAAELAAGIPPVLGQLREIVRGLIPLKLNADDLVPALRELVTTIEKQTGVRCRLDADPNVQLADGDAAVQLYRIAQEAITNAVKHARPGEIVVSLKVKNGHTEFAVRDDGVGIATKSTTAVGCGLRVMRHRARVIGGSMNVHSAVANGTSLIFTIPSTAS